MISAGKDVQSVIQQAFEAERKLEFEKALELYKSVEDYLTVSDGSVIRYVNLLVEFEEYSRAKEMLENLIVKNKYYTRWTLQTLAFVYEQLGETEKAIVVYKKLGDADKVLKLENELEKRNPKKAYLDKFMSLFSGREDVFSIQTMEGYYPVRRPLEVKDVVEHFAGRKTIGIYVMRSDDTVKFAAIDVDIAKNASEDEEILLSSCKVVAQEVYKLVTAEGLKAYVEFSGKKGYHIWIFFDAPVPAYKIRYVLKKIVEKINVPDNLKVEVFPKQDKLNGGLGNLIKAPLGKHVRTGKWCVFLDEDFRVVNNQLQFLMDIKENKASVLDELFREYTQNEGELESFSEDALSDTSVRKKVRNQSNGSTSAKHMVVSEGNTAKQTTVFESSKVLKKVLRNELALKPQDPILERLTNSCFIFSQIVAKAEAIAHVSDDEKDILVGILKHVPNGFELAKKILGKTIDYSEDGMRNLFDKAGSIPLTCEDIKIKVFSFSLALDTSRCVCRFSRMLNTPVNYVHNDESYIEDISAEDLAKRLVQKTHEKLELEIEVKRLKDLLKKKLSNGSVLELEGARISVLEAGEIRVEFV